MISGVKVGQVDSIALDKNFRARAQLDLDPDLKLPIDTSASIVTSGLLGDRYISLQLGGEDDVPQAGRRDHHDRVGGHPRALDRQVDPQY